MRKPTKKQMIVAANVLNWILGTRYYRKEDIENDPEAIIRIMIERTLLDE